MQPQLSEGLQQLFSDAGDLNLMSDDQGRQNSRGTRPRAKRIEVWLSRDERAEIDARAGVSGLTLSAYMRAAGLNHPVRSVLDLNAVSDLVKITGDLGRVAGLLKLWLAEKRGQGARSAEVEAMMIEFRQLQADLRAVMLRAIR